MIAIIDYGCGNLNAFTNSFKRLNVKSKIISKSEDLDGIKKIILPGVGSFDYVIKSFNNSGLREMVEKKVINDKIDVLGVCAGMQIMANSSEEGKETGLGWIAGKVKLIKKEKIKSPTKLPHMGWNEVVHKNDKLFYDIPNHSKFYFVHSYYFDNKNESESIAVTDYSEKFSCAIRKKNIYGVQFHPEKSHSSGQQLLKNFLGI